MTGGGLEQLHQVAGGLVVAERGATPPPGPVLHVGDNGPVERPAAEPLNAYNIDHVLWRRTWVLADRLIVEFLGVVLLEVRLADLRVVFDRPLATDAEQHLLLDHVLPLVLTLHGHIVLHGAVVHDEQAAVVLCGPSGAGKSTLTAFAWQKGWTVGGDDGAVLHLGPTITCEPTYPTIRLTEQSIALLSIEPDTHSRVMHKLRVTGGGERRFDPSPRPLALIVELAPVAAGAAAELVLLRGAARLALLFGHAFHLQLVDGPLLRRGADVLAEVADRVPVARLSVPRGVTGLAAAEVLLRDAVRVGGS